MFYATIGLRFDGAVRPYSYSKVKDHGPGFLSYQIIWPGRVFEYQTVCHSQPFILMSAEEVAQATPVEEPMAESVTKRFVDRAVLKGHNMGVTSLVVSQDSQFLVSGSRDHTALVWKLPQTQEAWGVEDTRLVGHNHFVSGVSLTSDNTHLLTCSWDKTIRLWDLKERASKKVFLDHKKDVLAVCFSPGNRRIISCSRDKTVKIWNTVGTCKTSLPTEDWGTSVTCYSADEAEPELFVAVGFWNGQIKVWKVGDKVDLLQTLDGHQGRCTSVAFSPDGQWIISGGTDRKLCMWKLEDGTKMMSFTASAPINCVACCPTRAWACAATYEGICVWDIQAKTQIDLVQPAFPILGKRQAGRTPECMTLAWQEDGRVLYAGYNNGEIHVWEVRSE